jgi:multidrug efflux pump
MRKLEAVALRTPGVKHTVSVSGNSVMVGTNAPNFATLYVMLDDFPNRHDPALSGRRDRVQTPARAFGRSAGARLTVFGAPAVEGLGTTGGFKLVVEDRGDTGPEALEEAPRGGGRGANGEAELRDAFTGYRADTPWLALHIDRDAAQMKGVAVGDIVSALQVYFGSLYINDFNLFGRTWQVNVQAEERFRRTARRPEEAAGEERRASRPRTSRRAAGPGRRQRPAAVEGDDGAAVRVLSCGTPAAGHGAAVQPVPAAMVTASPGPGASSGQALAALERTAGASLPGTMKAEWTELALLQLETKDTALRAFVLSVVLVFLVLAAQYESWLLPLAIILVVPMCLLSAAAGVLYARQDVNIFTQVGFVVLVGLACKNAILIVEFAKQRADAGRARWEAVVEACRLRLRPIVMTSVAFIIGVVPLVLAEGAGAEMRRSLGTAVFAGMIGVTLFGLFLTPVFFVVLQRVKEAWPGGAPGDAGRSSGGQDDQDTQGCSTPP